MVSVTLPGILQMIPDRLKEKSKAGNPPKITDLFVDVGLPAREVTRIVKIGDLVSFAQLPVEMTGNTVAGHSLDNRASVAALTLCLEELRRVNLTWDVWAVATIQEEETLLGARTSAFDLHPDIAVAIDVTFGKGPGSNDHHTFPLGKGPTIGVGANIHPSLAVRFKKTAEAMDLPYAVETMPKNSGTDAIAMQVTAEGIPCAVISIPLRYMHTPLEMVSSQRYPACGKAGGALHYPTRTGFNGKNLCGVKSMSPKTNPKPGMPTIGPSQLALLERLSNAVAVSGNEDEVRAIVLESVKPHADDIRVDAMGNVLVTCHSKSAHPLRVMLDAHMDEVGFMIVEDEGEGIYAFEVLGGVDERQLPAKSSLGRKGPSTWCDRGKTDSPG